MDEAARWFVYTGRHDDAGHTSTLAFLDHTANLRYPSKCFARLTPYACASPDFMFDEVYQFETGETKTHLY